MVTSRHAQVAGLCDELLGNLKMHNTAFSVPIHAALGKVAAWYQKDIDEP